MRCRRIGGRHGNVLDVVLRALHVCSGVGGFELALQVAGVPARTVAHVELDAFAAACLVVRMEDQALAAAPVWADLRSFPAERFRGAVDLVTCGFPCQPHSWAGKGQGVDDDRWLWPHISALIAVVGPDYVLLENVPGLQHSGLDRVLGDLAAHGFDAQWGDLSAAQVGAPQQRNRMWVLAHTDSPRRALVVPSARPHPHPGGAVLWPPGPADPGPGWRRWLAAGGPRPALLRRPDGPAVGLADPLRAVGDSLVPAVAAHALRLLAARMKQP